MKGWIQDQNIDTLVIKWHSHLQACRSFPKRRKNDVRGRKPLDVSMLVNINGSFLMNCSNQTIEYLKERKNTTNSTDDLPHRSGPNVTTVRQNLHQQRQHLQDRFQKAMKSARSIIGSCHRPIYAETVRRWLKSFNLSCSCLSLKVFLSTSFNLFCRRLSVKVICRRLSVNIFQSVLATSSLKWAQKRQ